MAEAEEVITDAARHATVFLRDLWQRRRPDAASREVRLADVAPRLGFLLEAVTGTAFPLRPAQEPAPPRLVHRVFTRGAGPRREIAIPATDGRTLWLPRSLPGEDELAALERYRALALVQAMRAARGSAEHATPLRDPLVRDTFLLLEALAADRAVADALRGVVPALRALRRESLAARPALAHFPPYRRGIEALARECLGAPLDTPPRGLPLGDAATNAAYAARIAETLRAAGRAPRTDEPPLLRDTWTGDLVRPPPVQEMSATAQPDGKDDDSSPIRTAELARRPEVRERRADEEDDARPGAWMIQTSQPHEHAEDPIGVQRPTDRDADTAAEEFADSLAELPEARLVSTPGRPKEVLLSADPPERRARVATAAPDEHAKRIAYPEWDFAARAYRTPGAIVRILPHAHGRREWIDRTLDEHRVMLDAIRRRFELLRARRERLRRQLDGEDVDLDAYIDAYADYRAGRSLSDRLYATVRPARRDMAILLLADASGSTDAWVSATRRIVDVEREALLLVCIALESLGEPYAVQSFSGEGPQGVTMRELKGFGERYGDEIALRIAALEPERYTRAGAALRHATATLMRQPASHRLLLLLSDGKPNDVDRYEGRYGVEDMRQAVVEAELAGIHPFCLTVDRQAAAYLPAVFGGHYALLPKPDLLAGVLLDWLRRLLV